MLSAMKPYRAAERIKNSYNNKDKYTKSECIR